MNPPPFPLFSPCSGSGAVRRDTADRTPVPEPDAPQTEKAPYVLLQGSDLRAREEIPPAEVPGQCRASGLGEESKNDGRASEDLVPEPQDQVEVGMDKPAGELNWMLPYLHRVLGPNRNNLVLIIVLFGSVSNLKMCDSRWPCAQFPVNWPGRHGRGNDKPFIGYWVPF